MKLSTSLLNDYLSRTMLVREQAEALERAGVEIEQIISSKPLDDKIIVVRIKKVVQHPNADRLHLVTINDGKADHTLVCGGQNVRPNLLTAWAQVGTVLPDGLELKLAKIRDIDSPGMLCTPSELGLSDDHSGVIELEADIYMVGSSLVSYLGFDDVLDITTHANRFDLLSALGLAREIVGQTALKLKDPIVVSPPDSTGDQLEVKVEASTRVRRYMLQRFKLGPTQKTPSEIVNRLAASGIRSINLAVDLGNYVMLEVGQPFHVFDSKKVKPPVIVRQARAGEKLLTLDGIMRSLTSADLIIADQTGPIDLAGVMGGKSTVVDDKTTEILVESASFDAATIRKMAQRHGLRTDASARFERGLPTNLAAYGLASMTAKLASVGAKPVGGLTDVGQTTQAPRQLGFRSADISRILGFEVTAKEIIQGLTKLGFGVEQFDLIAATKRIQADLKPAELVEQVYGQIGLDVGDTLARQMAGGQKVELSDLTAGDVLFVAGVTKRDGLANAAIYLGGDEVWEASNEGKWQVAALETVTASPKFAGARRYADNLSELIAVQVPWWRPDVKLVQDMAEEVIRLVGFDRLPATIPPYRPDPTAIRFDRTQAGISRIKQIMKSQALFEVITYSFVSAAQLETIGYRLSDHLKLKNPLSIEQAYLRSNLLPSLLATLARNTNYASEIGLFEISKVFDSKGPGRQPAEPEQLAVLVRSANGYGRIKAILDSLMAELHLDSQITNKTYDEMNPALSASIKVAGSLIGRIGELHPALTRAHKLSGQVGYLELDVAKLLAAMSAPQYKPLSKFPPVRRDIAVVVKQSVSWQAVLAVIAELNIASKIEFLSDYAGSDIPTGYKSLAVRLELSDDTKTLTDAEADQRITKITNELERKLAARPRA